MYHDREIVHISVSSAASFYFLNPEIYAFCNSVGC